MNQMPETPPNTRVLTLGAPACYIQPHNPAPYPVLHVGGVIVECRDRGECAKIIRSLTDYVLSAPAAG